MHSPCARLRAFIINAYAPELDEWCIYKYTRSHAVDLSLLSYDSVIEKGTKCFP